MTENSELSFYTTVQSLNTASQIVLSPVDGIISKVTISWPAGCNFLVEVLFRVKRIQFIPTPSTGGTVGIRLDAFTEQFTPNYPVTINDPIEMFIINHDSLNAHEISAIVHIESVDESEGAGTILHAKGAKHVE